MVKSLLILLCDPPFQYESADKACKIAEKALEKGHHVNIFLMMDGIYNPIVTQSGAPFHMRTLSEKLAVLITKGAKVAACRVCMKARGIEDTMIIPGLARRGFSDLSDMVSESDVILNFIDRG